MSKGKGTKSSPPPTRKPSMEPRHVHREPNDGKVDKAHAPFVPKPAHR